MENGRSEEGKKWRRGEVKKGRSGEWEKSVCNKRPNKLIQQNIRMNTADYCLLLLDLVTDPVLASCSTN